MKKIILIILLFSYNNLFAGEITEVTLTQIGEGRTKDEAKYNALRNTLEQAFGTFISSNTTLIDDELTKDEIVSVSSGNIQNFEILSETQMPNGSFSSVVKATVSIGNFTKFCESKGITVEFKGGLFAANIKLIELNKKNEIKVFKDLEVILTSLLNKLYYFSIITSDPIQYNNDLWQIPIAINLYSNSNLSVINDLIYNTLKSISLTENEKADFEKKGMYYSKIEFNKKLYILRSAESSEVLNSIFKIKLDKSRYDKKINNVYNSMLKFNLSDGTSTTSGYDIVNEVLYGKTAKSPTYPYFISNIDDNEDYDKPFNFSSVSDVYYNPNDPNTYMKIKLMSENGQPYLLNAKIKFYYILKMSDIEKIQSISVTPLN